MGIVRFLAGCSARLIPREIDSLQIFACILNTLVVRHRRFPQNLEHVEISRHLSMTLLNLAFFARRRGCRGQEVRLFRCLSAVVAGSGPEWPDRTMLSCFDLARGSKGPTLLRLYMYAGDKLHVKWL